MHFLTRGHSERGAASEEPRDEFDPFRLMVLNSSFGTPESNGGGGGVVTESFSCCSEFNGGGGGGVLAGMTADGARSVRKVGDVGVRTMPGSGRGEGGV